MKLAFGFMMMGVGLLNHETAFYACGTVLFALWADEFIKKKGSK